MDNKIIIEELKKKLGLNWNKIIALYQVGLIDGSVLSDVDLVVVINEMRYKKSIVEAITSLKRNIKIDLRKIVTEKQFVEGFQYEPYARFELIAGQELRGEKRFLSPEDEGLIKLSAMFFTSFLRNFYWLKEKKATNEEILVNLNDFSYVSYWLPDASIEIVKFNQSVRSLRYRYPKVTNQECEKALDEGIEHAWKLVYILNELLKKKIVKGKKSILFLERQPTLCIPASVSQCRKLTETRLKGKHRSKVIYLPIGFQIFSVEKTINSFDPLTEFIVRYRRCQLSFHYSSGKAYIKQFEKNIFAKILDWMYRFKDIYTFFSNDEAYSNAEALATYTSDHTSLLPAEQKIFDKYFLSQSRTINILDAACGGGRTTIPLLQAGFKHITAFDNQPGLIKAVQKSFPQYSKTFHVADLLNIEKVFKEQKFDIIFVSFNGIDYLYPFEQRIRFIKQAYNLLKPSGLLIFSSHNRWCLNRAYIQVHLANIFGVITKKKYFLTKHGFGFLLTYFGSIQEIIKEVTSVVPFYHVDMCYNHLENKLWRDPFPYFIFKKGF